MSDNLIEDIIRKSLAEQSAAPKPSEPPPEPPPTQRPPRKRLNPLLIPTLLLSVALVSALLGLIFQQWKFRGQLAEVTAEYEQTLIEKDRWIELRTEETEALENFKSLYYELYNETLMEVKGILRAEVIFNLYSRGAYQEAAGELIAFTQQRLTLPLDQQLQPADSYGSGASTIAGLLPLYRVDYQGRMEEIARSLLDMGLIEQTVLNYIVLLRANEYTISIGTLYIPAE